MQISGTRVLLRTKYWCRYTHGQYQHAHLFSTKRVQSDTVPQILYQCAQHQYWALAPVCSSAGHEGHTAESNANSEDLRTVCIRHAYFRLIWTATHGEIKCKSHIAVQFVPGHG
eukprot:927968-Rhodomonas_salina.1